MESRVKQHKKDVYLLYLLDPHSFQFVSDGKVYSTPQNAGRALSKNTRLAEEPVDAGEAWIRRIVLVVSDKDSVRLDSAEAGGR